MYLTGTWVAAPDAFLLLTRDGAAELVVRGGFGSGARDQIFGDSLKVVLELAKMPPRRAAVLTTAD